MNIRKSSAVCMIGLTMVLFGCGDSLPEASTINCTGRGLEMSLSEFRGDEAKRQAFLDQCDALKD